MPNFYITGNATTSQTLDFTQIGVIAAGGALTTQGTAVNMTDYSALTVDGTISGFSQGVSLTNGGQITIGESGVINVNSTGISMSAAADSNIFVVNNAGSITGSQGIFFTGLAASVVNSGDILAYLGTAVHLSGLNSNFETTLVNSGTISGRFFGVSSDGSVVERITNAEGGVIAGTSGAMSLSDAISIVVNLGLLSGSAFLGGGADQFDGRGGVQGDIFGGEGDDTLLGGANDDVLNGDEGADRIFGGSGDDLLAGGLDSDHLAGSAGDDDLNGASGNDTLTGGTGSDSLYGGDDDDRLVGGSDEDVLDGGSGNDTVLGGEGADDIFGGAGNDVLNGGAGNDILLGASGNDTYVVDTASDQVFETTTTTGTTDAGGIDTVQSSVSFNLDARAGVCFVERLTLTGTADINGTGNALNNSIVGNGGANTLNGGAGNDTLTGGGDADSFVFNVAFSTGNIDRITDFDALADTIRLENAIFTGLAAGTLATTAFRSNTSGNAADASDRIIYESDTGRLYFDSDGTGAAAKVHFATLATGLTLTSADFFVF
jgi:Ca2+-binding RTX toxin-like protein